MSRLLPSAFASFVGAGLGLLLSFAAVMGGCGEADLETASSGDGGAVRRDAAPVDPTEGGLPVDAGLGPPPDCEKYCDLVMENCAGAEAQYASTDECLAFCAHLPLVEPMRGTDEKAAPSVACRQYWADAPARTSPKAYCLAAGPFGGNTCGDRCTAFCSVALSACTPDGGVTAYASQPECATACAGFSYRDSNADGGGEGPDGPEDGDTLNCRLYWLRQATTDPTRCAALKVQSDACRN
ncbi:MAG: hypothetical protein KF795_03485 [Labilithrix sp.]|nr:hypothetical protein [Labilithrix sp.]